MANENNPGQWKAGKSGNPKGRPRGGEVGKLRAQIAEYVPELITKLIERAKEGDMAAARLLIERVIPPLKASEETATIALPDGTLTDQGRAVLAAIAEGNIPPGQGAAVLTSLGALAKLTETDELAARIAALEARKDTEGAKA